MMRAFARAQQFAPWPFPVIIQGETGTGKTRMAEQIHQMSPRAKHPFSAYSVANPDVELLSSDLFGHEKGGFTGAFRRREGLLASTQHGTVFFDEVGKCPPGVQHKLLQWLDSQQFRRVGYDRPLSVDVRLIVAANEPLAELVEQGLFSREFFMRLGLCIVHLPPLRERRKDIVPLANSFLAREAGKGPTGPNAPVPKLSDALAKALKAYPWPGNVRELERLMQALLSLGSGADELDVDLLDGELEHFVRPARPRLADSMTQKHERAVAALEKYGVQVEAARRLGVSPSTFGRWLKWGSR